MSGEYELTECTTEDLHSIQMTCISKQLAPAINSVLKQTRRHYAPKFIGFNLTNVCNWLKDRVSLSEGVQQALNCS